MLLYHGSNMVINNPDVHHSRAYLDFGQGFYLTSHYKQAKNWAIRKMRFEDGKHVINIYEFNANDLDGYCVKKFDNENEEWLEYIASNRNGTCSINRYDAVFGPVANDRVFEAVTMYLDGLWDEKTTLKALKFYKLNDQWCFKNQNLINNCLKFKEAQCLEE